MQRFFRWMTGIFGVSGERPSEKLEAISDMSEVRMIVGLGNPGKKYDGTRHNVGFDVVDKLAASLGAEVKQKKFGALFGQCMLGDVKVMFLKPQHYMNLSGAAVATAKGFYQLDIDKLIVVTDDMALSPGMIRIRKQGSSGGHNGLKDIIAKLGGNNFGRLRIGVGDSGQWQAADYVLARPTGVDKEAIINAVGRSCKALICWAENGADAAMSEFNSRSGN